MAVKAPTQKAHVYDRVRTRQTKVNIAMSKSQAMKVMEEDDTPEIVITRRKCLKCTQTFDSEWSGQRICSDCKKTAAWRSGGSAG